MNKSSLPVGQWNVSEAAAELHADALVCDTTLPWLPGYENQDSTLPRYAAAGVDFVSLTIGHDRFNLTSTIRHLADVKNRLRAEPDKYVLAKSVDDILWAKEQGRLAVGFNFQGSEGLEADQNMVEIYYDLGVRHMLLAYNQKNRAADGCHERTNCGLSRFGVKLIQEMNRVGMMLDLSHTGYRSTMEAMEVSKAPVVFSHSNAYALKQHARNIRDDQIRACAKTGGVIGINGISHFLAEGGASIENFVQHIDYVVKLVGTEHVAIGLDFVYFPEQMYRMYIANPARFPEGYSASPEAWTYIAPEMLPEMTECLLKLDYAEGDIRGILGQNFLRVARQVWK